VAEDLLRLREVAAVHPEFADLVVHVGVLRVDLQVALEAGQCSLVVSQRAVGPCEVDHRQVVIGLQAQRLLEVLDGGLRIAVPQLLGPEHEPGVDHVAVLGQHLAQQRRDFAGRRVFVLVALLRQVHGRSELVEQADLVLRVRAAGPRVGRVGDERPDVAEGGQPGARLRVHVAGGHRRLGSREPFLALAQLRDHPVGNRTPGVEDVGRLVRVPVDVVELRAWRVDHLVPSGAKRAEVAPAVMVQRVHRLRVRVEVQLPGGAGHQRHEARAGHGLRRGHTQQVEHGGHDVHRPHGVGHPARLGKAERRAEDEGHVRHAVVDEKAVRGLAVVAQALAVIAHHDDDRLLVEPASAQQVEHAPDLAVGKRHLTVVRVPLVARRERLGRAVRRVRIVEVNPREERRVPGPVDPRQGLVHHLVGGPLDRRQRHGPRLGEVEVVEVGVEALVGPPLRVEDVGGHERARPVPALLEHLGERDLLGPEEEPAVVAHAVLGRELPGEDARVHGQRERGHGHGLLEQHALAGERVEGRGLNVAGPIGANSVGAGGIEGHDHQVETVAGHAAGEGTERDAAGRLHRAGPQQRGGSGGQAEADDDREHEPGASPGQPAGAGPRSRISHPNHGAGRRRLTSIEPACSRIPWCPRHEPAPRGPSRARSSNSSGSRRRSPSWRPPWTSRSPSSISSAACRPACRCRPSRSRRSGSSGSTKLPGRCCASRTSRSTGPTSAWCFARRPTCCGGSRRSRRPNTTRSRRCRATATPSNLTSSAGSTRPPRPSASRRWKCQCRRASRPRRSTRCSRSRCGHSWSAARRWCSSA